MPQTRYNTKQREEVLSFLKSTVGEHITVNEICKHFANAGTKVGTTTIYRHLEKLVEEGVVKKYTLDATTAACFEYIDVHNVCQKHGCTHLKCTKCGKLIHLHCDDLKLTEKHMLEQHNFKLDMTRTVLYGLCQDCQ